MAGQITQQQLAELQRTNPQAAMQLMRQLGMTTPADNINANDAGIRQAMDWLGSDGMPTRVSADVPAANAKNASLNAAPAPTKQGRQDRGVPSNAGTPLPPRRPAGIDGINPSSPPSSASTDRMDYGSDTARTNARGGVKQPGAANKPPVAAAAAPPRIAEEIFGPPIPPNSATEAVTTGLPTPDVQASVASANQQPVGGITGNEAEQGPPIPAGMQSQLNAGSSWRDILSSILGPDPELVNALAAEGVDFNAMSPQDRMRAGAMGAQKFLAQNARKPAPKTSRQQSQR
jgi:hypothetical protein